MPNVPHTERVPRRATSVTLVARQFEADVRVERKEKIADGVVALTLSEVADHPLPPWTPGAHIDLILGKAPVRQYSLCGDPADQHKWRLGILRDPDGRGGSRYVHDELQMGDNVRVRGPRNNFPLVVSPKYLFIAGGIGITPILPMVSAAEAAGAEWELMYGGRQRASMAFLEELAEFGDRVSVRPQDETGLLDLDALLGLPREDTLVYCCGPEPLLSAVEARTASWPADAVHVERFSPKPEPEPAHARSFEVVLWQSELTLTISPAESILEVVEAADVDVMYSCSEGTCGSCETRVLEGTPDHRDSILSEAQRDANDCMMICVSRSLSARLVLDL